MISFVADTHAVLWYFYDDKRLSGPVRVLMDAVAPANQIGVSAITFSETVYLVEKGKISQMGAFDDLALSIADPDIHFVEVPVVATIISVMREVPREWVRDPWDRIIAATAIALDVPLLTKDARLCEMADREDSKLSTIW